MVPRSLVSNLYCITFYTFAVQVDQAVFRPLNVIQKTPPRAHTIKTILLGVLFPGEPEEPEVGGLWPEV